MVETISREEAAWLAGIIEGEGSFMIPRHKLSHGKVSYRAAIGICNTDAKLIAAVSEIWYKLGCKFYYQLKKTKNGFALSITSIGRGSTDKVINLVLPHLKSKVEQAELLREFNTKMGQGKYQRNGVEYYKAIQWEYVDRLSTLRVKTVNPQRLQRTASKPLQIG